MTPAEPLFAKLSYGNGGADRDRTDDLRLAKPALSQLSYSPAKTIFRRITSSQLLSLESMTDQPLTSHRQASQSLPREDGKREG